MAEAAGAGSHWNWLLESTPQQKSCCMRKEKEQG